MIWMPTLISWKKFIRNSGLKGGSADTFTKICRSPKKRLFCIKRSFGLDEQKGGDNIKPILLYQCEYC